MNNTYIIREADSDDAEKMILYLNQVGGESDNLLHGENEFIVPIEGVRRKLAMSKDSENSIVLIALDNEQIIARAELEGYYAARIRHRAKFSISVKKEYWNQGIGTEIMKRLLKQVDEYKKVNPRIRTYLGASKPAVISRIITLLSLPSGVANGATINTCSPTVT